MKNRKQDIVGRNAFGFRATLCRVFLLCCALLAFCAVGAGAQQSSSFTFEVDSKRGWQPTSLLVTAGHKLTFSAVGRWSVDARNFSYVGPEGYTPQEGERIYQGCKVDPSQPYGALLVRFGNDTGFEVVGAGGVLTPHYSGPVSFRINDADACLGDNGGSVKVTVTVATPPAKTTEVLTNSQVIELTKLGLSEATLIAKIRQSEHQFDTSVEALRLLKEAQVSDAVIREMINTRPSIRSVTLAAAHPGWTNTGMSISVGVRITFHATGRIVWDPTVPREGEVGPDGASWTPSRVGAPTQFPLPNAPIASLIGKIGEQVFPIGSNRIVRAATSGELLLGINERQCPTCYNDNSGSLQITIDVDK